MDTSQLFAAVISFTEAISSPFEVGPVLYRLTDTVIDVIDVAGAGIMLAQPDGELHFVAASDARGETLERYQDRTQEGPCFHAWSTGQPAMVADLRRSDRWSRYASHALHIGVTAVASWPLQAHGQRLGALNAYSEHARDWSSEDIQGGAVLAALASGYIVNSTRLAASQQLTEQLQHALDSRVIIEQAKGVLAHQHGVETQAAFDILRRHARSHNTRIHDVATAVVEGYLILPDG